MKHCDCGAEIITTEEFCRECHACVERRIDDGTADLLERVRYQLERAYVTGPRDLILELTHEVAIERAIHPEAVLNADMVAVAVDAIRTLAWDDEGAHVMEDRLHLAVLRAIGSGRCTEPALCAAAAAGTADIRFRRMRS